MQNKNEFGDDAQNLALCEQTRLGQKPDELINPLLACDTPVSKNSGNLELLKNKLTELIGGEIKNKNLQRASVYFRDLNSGDWMGVNEDDKYIPASLTKVPMLIAYYKLAETDSSILEKKIEQNLETDEDSVQEIIQPPNKLERGKKYSVNELLFRMIAYSGNNSHILLSQNLDADFQQKIFNDLSIKYDLKLNTETDDAMSPKTMASFFRILYNASYLSNNFSDMALKLLSNTSFADGIVAGVPSDMMVAHKFGERIVHINETGEVILRELHDCGIVYYPKQPYILCVMTQGMDFAKLKSAISQISNLTYQSVKDAL